MAYEVWPFDAPNRPVSLNGGLPLVNGQPEQIGFVNSVRDETRPVVNVTGTLFLEADEIQSLITFWKTTLKRGKKKFTADWIADVGYSYYVGKLLSYRPTPNGCAGDVSLQLQLIPDVRLDGSNKPEPWPAP